MGGWGEQTSLAQGARVCIIPILQDNEERERPLLCNNKQAWTGLHENTGILDKIRGSDGIISPLGAEENILSMHLGIYFLCVLGSRLMLCYSHPDSILSGTGLGISG